MSLTLHTNLRALLLAASTLTIAACPGNENETDSSTGTATDATTEEPTSETSTSSPTTTTGTPTEGGVTEGQTGSTTTTSDTATDTGNTETMGGETTTTTEGTTTVSTDTEADTDTDTGPVVPPELDAACMAACDKFFECQPQPPFPDVETCKNECADSFGGGEMCLDATVAFNSCIGEMTCDQLMDALANEEFGPCADEFEAMNLDCAGGDCESFGSSNGADSCSIGKLCPDQPSEEFSCEGDTCTCLVDDMSMDTCPAVPDFCDLTFEEQEAAAFECCGFEL